MLRNFLDGVRAYRKAWDYVGDLRLWPFFLVPAIISVFLAVVIGVAAWTLSDDIAALFLRWIPFGGKVVETIGRILGGLLVAAVGLAIFKTLVLIIAGPFMSPLSEKIEAYISGEPYEGAFSVGRAFREMARGLGINVRNLAWELFLSLLLIILGFAIPIVAPAVPFLIFFVQAYYAGFGNMDFTLERHMGYRDSILFVGDFRGLALGNGTIYMLMLFTGVGFVFALPLGTIAATLGTVERLRA